MSATADTRVTPPISKRAQAQQAALSLKKKKKKKLLA